MGARNRVGIGLSYRPARLHRLAESIHGLIKRLQIRALVVSERHTKHWKCVSCQFCLATKGGPLADNLRLTCIGWLTDLMVLHIRRSGLVDSLKTLRLPPLATKKEKKEMHENKYKTILKERTKYS